MPFIIPARGDNSDSVEHARLGDFCHYYAGDLPFDLESSLGIPCPHPFALDGWMAAVSCIKVVHLVGQAKVNPYAKLLLEKSVSPRDIVRL